MARKKEAKVEVVNEVTISKTLVLVTYSDGTSEIRFKLTSDELEKLVAAVSPAEEDDDEEEEEEIKPKKTINKKKTTTTKNSAKTQKTNSKKKSNDNKG